MAFVASGCGDLCDEGWGDDEEDWGLIKCNEWQIYVLPYGFRLGTMGLGMARNRAEARGGNGFATRVPGLSTRRKMLMAGV